MPIFFEIHLVTTEVSTNSIKARLFM